MGLELKPDKGIKDSKFQPRQPLNPARQSCHRPQLAAKTHGENFWRQIRMQSRQGRNGKRGRKRERRAEIESEGEIKEGRDRER